MFRISRILILSALALTMNTTTAQTRGDLGSTMKSMGAQFKILFLALIKNQPTPPESVKAAAGTLVRLIEEAATKTPSQTLSKADLDKYDGMIANLLAHAKNLQAALEHGDSNAAATILKEGLIPAQRAGHDAFKSKD